MSMLRMAAALGAAVSILPSAAFAMCGERAALAAALMRDWRETPRFRGLAADGRLVEIFLAPSGSWSALAARPDGTACLVGAGEAGAILAPPARPGEPS
jgi:hypothetical protein